MQNLQLLKEISLASTEVGKIYKTKNYGMFGKILGNREVNKGNKKRIKRSISLGGYVDSCAIICGFDPSSPTNPLKILDGNHRYESCTELDVPISYTIDYTVNMNNPDEVRKKIIQLNTASKTWVVGDYMKAYSEIRNNSYELYNDLFKRYGYDHDTSFYILGKKRDENIDFDTFRNQKLVLTQDDHAYMEARYKIFDRFKELTFVDPFGRTVYCVQKTGNRQFFKALSRYLDVPGFDVNHLMRKMSSNGRILTKCTNVKEALELIRDVYNRKSKMNRILITERNNEIINIEIV